MQENLQDILKIQELDIKMIRLMQMKHARNKELEEIESIHKELVSQMRDKQDDIDEMSEQANLLEQKIKESTDNIKKLEGHQSSIKKIDEFNALTKEIALCEKEKSTKESELSDLVDQQSMDEEILVKTKETLKESEKNNVSLKKDISETIAKINLEGRDLISKRNLLIETADKNILEVYEKLLRNKKDRVIVPIENRICQGCNISLTAQHEMLVRKQDNLIFCDHCSRIHYWDGDDSDGSVEVKTVKRRRRRAKA